MDLCDRGDSATDKKVNPPPIFINAAFAEAKRGI